MKENIFHIDDLVIIRSYEEAGEFGIIEKCELGKCLVKTESGEENFYNVDLLINLSTEEGKLEAIQYIEKLNSLLNDDMDPNSDANTILNTLITTKNQTIRDMASNIFDIWKESKDRKSIEILFEEMTGCSFTEYLGQCNIRIKRYTDDEMAEKRFSKIVRNFNMAHPEVQKRVFTQIDDYFDKKDIKYYSYEVKTFTDHEINYSFLIIAWIGKDMKMHLCSIPVKCWEY